MASYADFVEKTLEDAAADCSSRVQLPFAIVELLLDIARTAHSHARGFKNYERRLTETESNLRVKANRLFEPQPSTPERT